MQADNGAFLMISGGTVVLDAEGDGLNPNVTTLISGGEVTGYGPTPSSTGRWTPTAALQINGGTLVALDSGRMTQSRDAAST